jgi:hypothetical protein
MDASTVLAILGRICRELDEMRPARLGRALLPLAAPAALGLGLGAAGCPEVPTAPDARDRPAQVERCDDRLDNDSDGRIDCDDPDCARRSSCTQAPVLVPGAPSVVAELCGDGVDNDSNGLTDCGDPQCAGDLACQLAPRPTVPPPIVLDAAPTSPRPGPPRTPVLVVPQLPSTVTVPVPPEPEPTVTAYGAPFGE